VEGAQGNGEDAAEKKKAAKKARKEAQKAEREAAEKAAKQDPNKSGAQKGKEGEEPKKKDDDPNGLKLAATTDPLGDAMKFLGHLLQFSPKNIEAQIAGFEVFIRRSESIPSNVLAVVDACANGVISTEKYLLALRCLKASIAINMEHPKIVDQASRLRQAVSSALDSLAPKVKEVIEAELATVPGA
jgi:hypothetical protein